MLWFYARDHQSLTLETRHDDAAARFVVRVRWPDGREQVEHFSDLDTFRTWLTAFERAVEADCWQQNNVVVLPYGWPAKRPT
jgi:hypothetical protein